MSEATSEAGRAFQRPAASGGAGSRASESHAAEAQGSAPAAEPHAAETPHPDPLDEATDRARAGGPAPGPRPGTTLEELLDRVRAGLRSLEVVLDEVVEPPVPDAEAPAHSRTVAKIAGEAGMLLRMASRALPDAESQARIRSIATRLSPYARSGDIQRALVLRPSRAPMRALAHACLQDVGVRDDNFDRLARLALGSSVAHANERVPYRLLDAAWMRHLFFGDRELDHPALALSPIGAGVDLLRATTEDGYAFTHALVYATDFGRVPLPGACDSAALASTADGLCVKALDENDLDLLGEALMAPAALRRPWTPIQVFSWRALDRVWREHGFVPGPGLPPPADDEDDRTTVRRVLGTAYHTMFVGAICAATLACAHAVPPPAIPAVEPAGDAGDAGARTPGTPASTTTATTAPDRPDALTPWAGEALACAGTAGLAEWAQTSPEDRGRLGALVLGFRIRRAVAQLDLAALGRAVEASIGAGLLQERLVWQAVELLERAEAL